MKKLLLGCAMVMAMVAGASAADMPVYSKAPPPLPPPMMMNWTGFYIGGNIGAAWVNRDVVDTTTGVNFGGGSSDGVFIGGGQIGGNYQFEHFVLGIEWDFDWAANNNNGVGVVTPNGTIVVTGNNRWVSTLAARFGWAFDHWLFYGKVGGGWVGNDGFTVTNATTGASVVGSNSFSDSGLLLGVGIEWAFAPHWSAKIEYDHLDLNTRTFSVPAGAPFLAGDTFTSGDRNVQMLKFGINWRFGGDGPYYRGGPYYGGGHY